jgi:arabinose-5-phosphate isomerase
MISHSGNTSELVETIPSIKRAGVPIISLTPNTDSKLAKYSDVVLNTYVIQEACPFNLARINSTTVSLAYGDALAISLLKIRGFKEEEFVMCHPGGILGKRLLKKVSDIMIMINLPINGEKDSFKEPLATMTKGRQGMTKIVDGGLKCIGILTDGDIRRIFEKYEKVSDIQLKKTITRNPKSISPDALATEAFKKMQDNKITSLVVVDTDNSIIGLIHIHHLLEQGFY